MRESYRLQKPSLKNKLERANINLSVFFIYTGTEIPKFTEVYQKFGVALERLEDQFFFKDMGKI